MVFFQERERETFPFSFFFFFEQQENKSLVVVTGVMECGCLGIPPTPGQKWEFPYAISF